MAAEKVAARRSGQFYLFKQYLFTGAQFSEAGLNGNLVKRKNNTKDNRPLKKSQLQDLSNFIYLIFSQGCRV